MNQNYPFRFFFDQVPSELTRIIYKSFETAVTQHEDECDLPYIPGFTTINYLRILQFVYNDHPEIFYICPYTFRSFVLLRGSYRAKLFYIYDKKESVSMKSQLDQRVDEILNQIFPAGYAGMDDLKKEKYVFDWITRNITYDHESLDKLKDDYSNMNDAFNAYGALVRKTAVCHGISIAFKLLCDRLNLPSIVVTGDAGGRHVWNIVKIDERFYHIDCTWGLKSSINMKNPLRKYQYFNVPDEIMLRNHIPEMSFLPKCHSLRYNPFKQQGLCVRDNEELCRTIVRMLKKGEKRFAVMCVYGEPTEEEQKQLFTQIAREVGIDFTYYNSLSYIGIVVE